MSIPSGRCGRRSSATLAAVLRNRKPVQPGFTLIELVIFIVIVSVAVAGVLAAMDYAARNSSDPVVQKQALAIAQSLLEEVQQQPFTYCDPNDLAVSTATSAARCTGGAGGANDEGRLPLGPEAGETRYGTVSPFDNVSDYNGYNTATEVPPGVKDITGAPITGIGLYNAAVTVAPAALGTVPAGSAVLITVTVTGPANVTVTINGYRTRYAPNG